MGSTIPGEVLVRIDQRRAQHAEHNVRHHDLHAAAGFLGERDGSRLGVEAALADGLLR